MGISLNYHGYQKVISSNYRGYQKVILGITRNIVGIKLDILETAN